MNERIWQLQGQAKRLAEEIVNQRKYDDYMEYKQSLMDQTMNKFAELIVRECAEQIVAKGTDWVDFAPSQTGVRPEYWSMAQHIKEHFGVEE